MSVSTTLQQENPGPGGRSTPVPGLPTPSLELMPLALQEGGLRRPRCRREPLSVIQGTDLPHPHPDFLPSSDVDPSQRYPFLEVEVKAPSVC